MQPLADSIAAAAVGPASGQLRNELLKVVGALLTLHHLAPRVLLYCPALQASQSSIAKSLLKVPNGLRQWKARPRVSSECREQRTAHPEEV